MRELKTRYAHSHGYVIVRAPGHPRTTGGRDLAFEHRVVFTDTHGEGPFECHWCSKEVTWNDLHIDHLDEVKNNNSPGNLVASCPSCNQRRGFPKKRAWDRAQYGITFNGETLTPGEWASRIGISIFALKFRLKSGWPLERALTEPRGKFGPQSPKRGPR